MFFQAEFQPLECGHELSWAVAPETVCLQSPKELLSSSLQKMFADPGLRQDSMDPWAVGWESGHLNKDRLLPSWRGGQCYRPPGTSERRPCVIRHLISHSASPHWPSRCFSNFFLFLPQGLCTCFSLCLELSFLRYLHLRSSFSLELCSKEASLKAGLALSPPTFILFSPLPLSEHFCLFLLLIRSTVLKLRKLKTKFLSPPFISLWMVKEKGKKNRWQYQSQ